MHTTTTHDHHLHTYDDALANVRERFAALTDDAPLFVTDAYGLWDIFLAGITPEQRQHYTCNACRHFIQRYGNLAIIDPGTGRLHSALWDHSEQYPHGLSRAFAEMAKAVRRASIVTVFRAKQRTLGTPTTGDWHHFSTDVSARHVHKSQLTTAHQAMAEKREEFAMLSRSFGDFSHDTVRHACELLKSGQLYRSEKCIGVATWLLALYDEREKLPSALRDNATWRAVASAPAGFCHVRSGMIGTLLEDVQAGLPFAEVKRRFDEKMNPLQYLRPQAGPSAGHIAQAERVVAALASAGALARRFARLDEVDAFWTPRAATPPASNGGVFGHLLNASPKHASTQLPTVTMTWAKFRDKVLTDAVKVEYRTTYAAQSYCAIVTAVDPTAPPLMQWDNEEKRNPASWYLYVNGSRCTAWGLTRDTWVNVDAFTVKPCNWYGRKLAKDGEGVIAILHGARDINHHQGGGFFPENLRSEYHGVRRTLEAYAKTSTIAGKDDASACGLMLTDQGRYSDVCFRVTSSAGTVSTYNIDRWD